MAQPSPSEFQPYRKVQGAAEKELRRILELTAKAIEKRVAMLRPGVGGVVRAAQLRATLAAIRKLQRAMWVGSVTPAIARQVEAALEAGESAVEALTRVAYTALNEPAAETLVAGLRAAAESGLKSDAARKRRELSERVYKLNALHAGKIEETIRAGLIANLSAKELASDVYKYVSPNTKGGASYAAMRLARTEINNAFHERQIEGAKRPGVEAVQWNLSGSHKVPDECNIYAEHKPYPPDEVPDKPHPQCFCYLTYVMMPPEEFRAKLEAGGFDDEIQRRVRENMALLGQPVGDITPLSVVPDEVQRKEPLTGQAAHDVVPKGLFKRGSLTPQQRRELKTYESGWFIVINGFLRGKKWGDSSYRREEKTVTVIRTALDESVLPQPIQTWRGMFNSRSVFGEAWDNDLTGFEWDDLGFGSTTTVEEVVNSFNLKGDARPGKEGDTKMKVSVPAGVKALQVSTHTQGSKENGAQAEIMLENGLTWRVVKDHGFNSEGVRELEVQVSPIRKTDD